MVNLKSLENSCVSKPVGLLRESVLGVPSDVFLRHTGVRVLAGPRRTEGQTMDEFNKPYFFLFPFPAQAYFLQGADNQPLWSFAR